MSIRYRLVLSASLCLTGMVLAGCSKSQAPKPAVAPPAPQKTTTISTETKPEDAPPPPPTAAAAPAADAAPAAAAPPPPFKFDDNDALTMLVNQFKAERGRLPTTVNELITTGYAMKLPSPPDGKHFVIVKNSDGSGKVQAQ